MDRLEETYYAIEVLSELLPMTDEEIESFKNRANQYYDFSLEDYKEVK